MSHDQENQSGGRDHEREIKVKVIYPAARKPLELEFEAHTILATIKAVALEKLNLKEGPTPDGQGTATYTLFFGKDALTDLTVSIFSIAGKSGSIMLKLVQQITQG